MAKKEKGTIAKLAPVAISCLFLGAGSIWLIVGLVISIVSSFDPNAFNPVYWIIAGSLFVIGLAILIPSLISNKK